MPAWRCRRFSKPSRRPAPITKPENVAPTLPTPCGSRGLAGRGSRDASPLSPVQTCSSRFGAAGSSPEGANFPRGGPSENCSADEVAMDARWLIPDWAAPRGVRAAFTTRSGGVSAAPYDSMNLGDQVGDLPEMVAANRALLQQATAPRAVFLKQVHGSEVLALQADSPDGQQADACVTVQRQLACTIM